MKTRRLFWAFLLCSVIDIFNKNFYLAFDNDETVKKIYWTGQSFTFVCYVLFIWLVGMTLYSHFKDDWSLLLKLAALNWLVFAVGDFIDELTGNATDVYLFEYLAFGITILLTLREWKRHKRAT